MNYVWNPEKARFNREKHGIRFADAVAVLEDVLALTIPDHHADEDRFITIGEDAFGQILVVVYTYRGEDTIRMISARVATRQERRMYREGADDDT
ncbi:MAG: BrnT family toxin [Chloroflexales bacterium]